MKRFTPSNAEVAALQAEKSVGLLEAKAILTGRGVLVELESINSTLCETNATGDNLREQLLRLTEVVHFIVTSGSVGF